jgi:hypothetical protein
LSSDLPSSIQPVGPKMRLSPEPGLIRDALGANNLLFQLSEPRPAWLSDRGDHREARTARRATAASFHPAEASGRQGSKSSTSARPNEKLAVITSLQARSATGR